MDALTRRPCYSNPANQSWSTTSSGMRVAEATRTRSSVAPATEILNLTLNGTMDDYQPLGRSYWMLRQPEYCFDDIER